MIGWTIAEVPVFIGPLKCARVSFSPCVGGNAAYDPLKRQQSTVRGARKKACRQVRPQARRGADRHRYFAGRAGVLSGSRGQRRTSPGQSASGFAGAPSMWLAKSLLQPSVSPSVTSRAIADCERLTRAPLSKIAGHAAIEPLGTRKLSP